MHLQIDSRRIAPALATDEEVAMAMTPPPTTQQQQQQRRQQSALDADPHHHQQQQQLVIQTRDLALVTPSPSESSAGTPLGSSPRLTPFAERGDDATPHHYLEQGEPASMLAGVLDAQPPTLAVTGNQGSETATTTGDTEIFNAMPVAVDHQNTAVGLRRSSASTLMADAPGNFWPSGNKQPSPDGQAASSVTVSTTPKHSTPLSHSLWNRGTSRLDGMPNEVLAHILSFLDVCDLLATSRTSHHFRALSVHPLLHVYRLRRARAALPPLLTSPSRPTLPELIARHIFQTRTTQVSRRLARSLAAIRLSRRLPQRPSAESLAQRGVLPPECAVGLGVGVGGMASEGSIVAAGSRPGTGTGAGSGAGSGAGAGAKRVVPLSPALVARKRAVERERLKDGLRRWVGAVWRGEVRERSEGVRRWEESAGVGRVWRLRRFWERVGREEAA